MKRISYTLHVCTYKLCRRKSFSPSRTHVKLSWKSARFPGWWPIFNSRNWWYTTVRYITTIYSPFSTQITLSSSYLPYCSSRWCNPHALLTLDSICSTFLLTTCKMIYILPHAVSIKYEAGTNFILIRNFAEQGGEKFYWVVGPTRYGVILD